MPKRRSRTPWVLLTLALLFAASEIGLRLLTDGSSRWNMRLGTIKQFDPVTQFRLKPDYVIAPGVVTNEGGYLAPKGLPFAKSNGKLRIAYLGDSVTVLPAPGFYPTLVEQHVREAGLDVETLNAAVPGYSTKNARALFESDLSRYDADYFFVYLGWNDLGQYGPEGLPYKRDDAGYALNPVQRFLTNVYTLRLLYASQQLVRRLSPSVYEPLAAADEALYAGYYPTHYEENLRSILRLAKSRYPNVLLMNLATITNDDPTEWELETAHYPTGMDKNMKKLHGLVQRYNDVVAKVAREEQVELIDLYRMFDDPEARREFTDSCHVNHEGAARIADAVTKVVLRREGRPPGGP